MVHLLSQPPPQEEAARNQVLPAARLLAKISVWNHVRRKQGGKHWEIGWRVRILFVLYDVNVSMHEC